jgi:uncharacterized protein YprB with RNaseH-like and TPR domain
MWRKAMSKVLIFDIETSPNLGYTWGKWEQNVIQFAKESKLLSFAYKWHGEKSTYCFAARKGDEKALVHKLHALLIEADVIVAHNGDSFDIKKAQTRMIEHGLEYPGKLVTVDTKKVAKKHFAFNSNSLNDLGMTLGLGKKLKHSGFDTWLGCMSDDEASWVEMIKYNKMDVVLLEKVYDKFLANGWLEYHTAFKGKKRRISKSRGGKLAIKF